MAIQTVSSFEFFHGFTIHSKTLRKKQSSHGTTITRQVNKIGSYSTKEPLPMDAAQLNDFLTSLKKGSEDYFEAHRAIIDKCASE